MDRLKNFVIPVLAILFCIQGLPVSAQESEAPIPFQWGLSPILKWDALGWDSQQSQWLSGDLLVGIEALHRLSKDVGIGVGLNFSATLDSAIEVSAAMRYYYLNYFLSSSAEAISENRSLLDIIQPYAGLQLAYLTRDKGGFSLALQPGLEVALLPSFKVNFFLQGRYDIAKALLTGQFLSDFLLLGSGMSAQVMF